MMKKLLPFIAICFLFCCFSCNQNNEKLLYVIIAKDGNIKKQNDNTFILTLKETQKTVTYFTDRPQRKAGKITLEYFISNWDKMFKKDPPNGAYVFHATNDNPLSEITAELTDPKYNYHDDILTFTIKPLLTKTGSLHEQELGETAIFIDSAPAGLSTDGGMFGAD